MHELQVEVEFALAINRRSSEDRAEKEALCGR